MTTFLQDQLLFITITFAILILPGWLFLRAFFHRNYFTPLERLVLSVPVSFTIITFSFIIIDAFNVAITQKNILITIGTIVIVLFFLALFVHHKKNISYDPIFNFTKKQTVLVILLILFTITAKGIFLANAIVPTATDLGHHMFWVEKITKEQALPIYEKIEIDTTTPQPQFTPPQKIADFIVGEHIIFAIIKILTDQSVVSTFPSLVLFIFNVFTVLILFILTRRFFEKYRYGTYVAILLLLFIGPLWTISGAGAKFVSGGVIGNLIGNLLIPTIFYFLYRAFTTKQASFLAPAIIVGTALAYTHHLSTFIFGYIFIFSIIAFIILQKNGWDGYKKIFSLFKNPYIIPLLLIAIFMLFVFAPPSYLDTQAISSSIGTPSKSTRTGIPPQQLMIMLGEARFILGIIGLGIMSVFFLLRRFNKLQWVAKKNIPTNIYATAFLCGWATALLAMSIAPHLLKVNIISSRIATYNAFPLAILAGFAIVWITIFSLRKNHHLAYSQFLLMSFLLILITFTFTSGLHDNATSLNSTPKTTKALQTFHAGTYANAVFKGRIANNDFWILKDHNYITADTWLKVFFAYDYAFPLSRSYFKRYETHPDREKCTLAMISDPHSTDAQICFDNLNVHAVLVNTQEDAGQFLNDDDFYRIYQNNELSLFIRK